MIYLACPYSSDTDPLLPVERYHTITEIAARLIADDYYIYSPITHCHPMHLTGHTRGDFPFWRQYDFYFIKRCCDMVVVAMLDGWKDSVGVRAEIEFAEENDIPVKYLDPETLIIHQEPLV